MFISFYYFKRVFLVCQVKMREKEAHKGRNGVLNVSNLPGEHTSLDSIGQLHDALTGGNCKRYVSITAQHDSLLSLTLSPSLASAVQHITSLTASHNRLSTLQGIEAFVCLEFLDLSHNALRILDAHSTTLLRKLRCLKRCNFSYNEICMADFDTTFRCGISHNESGANKEGGIASAATPMASAGSVGPAVPGFLEELTHLDLSHNQLIEVPDLRCIPVLEELNLSYNRIDLIADLDNRLPLLRLCSFSISHNSLAVLPSLLPLTVLAGTLCVLNVAGNPCVQDFESTDPAMGGIRAWLLWLLPYLELLDEVPLTTEERQIACKLFRRNNKLSYELMDVMNTNNGTQLVSYLRKFTQRTTSRSLVGARESVREKSPPSPNPAVGAVNGGVINNVGGIRFATGAVFPSASPSPAADGTVRRTSSKPQPIELVVQMLQWKVRQLSNVMEVLWQESMARRVFAVRVLQRHVRGFLARRQLPEVVHRTCTRIRTNMLASGQRPYFPDQRRSAKADTTLSVVRSLGCESISTAESEHSVHTEIMQRIDNFDHLFRQMEEELHKFRIFWARTREKSAVVVQKYYRGYLDRKRWRNLKESYDVFIDSLRPYVVELQRVSRGYVSRARLAKDSRQLREMSRLRGEVAGLRAAVDEMRAILQQYAQKQRRGDPESPVVESPTRRAVAHSIPLAKNSAANTGTTLTAAATAAAAQASAVARISPEL
ncbi:leucine-rich repeat protein (LRRP), putative [Trypanosoma brucei gambiense DAL972]|uniref:Leucine-rich repeat protein (LRRP), putative n=2 Tax=Trypanosoma brucei TaxID=5691 RepID=D0A962_TRYB9|nr:leucine-rich repeat protein (LRRP), putative [Trypanosoma brucei gambiense DAL972]CBH18213.1 leucine-rich repeat protein (LRRP), putative [Trypanosoma brucei gambiense DAL972]|eukprot:XP_011780477.1 leucine-rich repeat protein (LRRP), putative [Trypanosoma brucei gambiense DAL972]